jgi:hypothetical protein
MQVFADINVSQSHKKRKEAIFKEVKVIEEVEFGNFSR